MFHSDQALM